jgi:deoxyribose-phosphate aldolase
MNAELAASMIDHTLLKAEATPEQIDQLCDQALEHGFAAVCVNPLWVKRCADRLKDSSVDIATVAGFPLGANLTATKVDEAQRAIDEGAVEVDMVIRVGDLIAGETDAVRDDIAAVGDAVHAASDKHLLKVILETAALTDEQIIAGCRCVAEAQADYVKTSTGFHPAGGATLEAVQLLHKHTAPIKVKAAGGIRSVQAFLGMVQAGASRIGTSSGVQIVTGLAP